MNIHYQYNNRILWVVSLFIIIFSSTFIIAQCHSKGFDDNYYKAHLKFLANDLLEGRKPGTKGGDLAALYIAKQFESIGLKPISDEQGYYQMIPLIGYSTEYNSVRFTIQHNGQIETLKPFEDVVVFSQELNEFIQIKDDLLFVGYGIDAPEYGWDDFKGQDVSGKILVVLCNDPDYETTGFGSESWTYYSMWDYKEEMATIKGAKGIIIIHNDEMATFPFSVVQNSIAPGILNLENRTRNPTIYAWISQPAFDRVLSHIDLNFDMLKKKADSKDFQPIPLNLTADIAFKQNYSRCKSPNVIGILPGTEIADEAVIYMAHYDHLGIGKPVKGDSIYNGARDNASGTAALISLANAFCTHPTKRSIIFLATTGEESGKLGSKYYTTNPVFPLTQTIIGFNMDMMSFYGKREMFSLYPIECSDAVQRVKLLGKDIGLKLEPDGIDKWGLFFRSDHSPFNAQGVATFTIGLGGKYLTMSKDDIDKIRKQVGYYYHQPNDEVYSWFNYDGVMQELNILSHLGRYYANQDEKPKLKLQNPYNAVTRIFKIKQEKGIY